MSARFHALGVTQGARRCSIEFSEGVGGATGAILDCLRHSFVETQKSAARQQYLSRYGK